MDDFEKFMNFCEIIGFDLSIDNIDKAKKLFYERNKSMDYILVRRYDNPYEEVFSDDFMSRM